MNSKINKSLPINQDTTNSSNSNKTIKNYLNQENNPKNITNISNKKVDSIVTNNKSQSRAMVGGKAAALYRLQQAGMQVPEFTTIDVNQTANLEQHIIDITSLQAFMSDINDFNLKKVNIANIKQAIQTLYAEQPEKRNESLQGLANFIASDAFYKQVNHSQPAISIRENYNQLIASLPENTPLIVRSSGIKEDNYGDAQAGKFESIVHGKQDILQTCLQVLASGFQPNVCPVSTPQPMALILQRCIDCSFGGVAMSRTSQNDNRGKIEYVQGQPKGGVSGLAGVTPHCYLVSHQENELTSEFIEGNVNTKFILNQQDANNFAETAVNLDDNTAEINLTTEQLQQIYQYLQQGEDMLLCPADIEFAIAQDGIVYIVQLRPLTVLTGGVNYASEPPADPLATGTLVSEGFCSGELYYVKNQQDAQNIPEGAIVVAEHGEDWMITTNFLQKVSGFIFAQGGTNDHVAITLRQQEKPCLIAKDNFTAVKNSNEVVTMACCSFNGTAGAYVVNGSELADKLANMQSAVNATYQPRSSAKPIRTTPKLKFASPDIAFKNLHDLNYKLLDYFNADSWLSRCFSEKGMIALSMAPHRIAIIEEAKQEIEQMFADFELFLNGYKQYLQLGIKPEKDDANLPQKLAEAQQLADEFQQIKANVYGSIDNILQQFTDLKNQTITEGDFNNLLQEAKNIFEFTQKLNIPQTTDEINSIHDCIFWIHKEFIDAIATVAINSGLGKITEHEHIQSIIFSATEEQEASAQLCMQALSKLKTDKPSQLVIMENATIATASLGVHACTIEMLEQAEAGKGRTLKLKLSDDFTKDKKTYQGKLKRFWFLAQLLHNINFAEDSGAMQVSVDEATGVLAIEIPHIQTKQAIINKFKILLLVLNLLADVDIKVNNLSSNQENSIWDFAILKQRLIDFSSITNQQLFNHLFILLGCTINSNIFSFINTNEFHHQLNLIKKLRAKNYLDENELQVLLNNIDHIDQESLLKDLLATKVTSITSFAKSTHPEWFNDKETMLKLVSVNGLLLKEASSELQNDPDVVSIAASNNMESLKYASIKLTSNTEFILNFSINVDSKAIEYAEADAKYNEDMLLKIINNNFLSFQYVCNELQQNKFFLLKAINVNPHVYIFIEEPLRSDKEILQAYKKAMEK